MLALLFDWLSLANPLYLLFGLFALWMFVDALRRGEWLWAVFILIFAPLNAPLYFFLVYRNSGAGMSGFELPGARNRARIKELEDRIHHLDKARDHADLGDIYFQQGKLAKAEACYRAALEREPEDIDTQAHYGQCLLRSGRPQEALPLLERVVSSDPEHDFGHTQMALAETYGALGDSAKALTSWRRVLERNTYARARVQLAELLIRCGQVDQARAELEGVLSDDVHAPSFQRRRERVWVAKAGRLLKRFGRT
jgi:tetratricopeptide (TPR) repeat protein